MKISITFTLNNKYFLSLILILILTTTKQKIYLFNKYQYYEKENNQKLIFR